VLAADRRLSGGMLGTSILYASIVRARMREVAEVVQARGRARASKAAALARPPECPICAHVRTTVSATCQRLVALAADPAWADAIGRAEVCGAHLSDLLARSGGRGPWHEVEARQAERLSALAERLDRFGHHSSHDRRHLMTADEAASVTEAARFLGGDPS
jgi:hypothetical protein